MKSKGLEFAIIAIGLGAYFGVTPLFDAIGGGVAESAIGAGFSAMFVVLATKILLGHDSSIGQKQKQSEAVLEARLKQYALTISNLISIVNSGELTREDAEVLKGDYIRLQALAPDELLTADLEVYRAFGKEGAGAFSEADEDDSDQSGEGIPIRQEKAKDIYSAIVSFSERTRENLGLANTDTSGAKDILAEDFFGASDIIEAQSRKARAPLGRCVEEWVRLRMGDRLTQSSIDALNIIERIAGSLVTSLSSKVTKSFISLN